MQKYFHQTHFPVGIIDSAKIYNKENLLMYTFRRPVLQVMFLTSIFVEGTISKASLNAI